MKRLTNDGKRAIACLLAWALLHAMCALASEHGDDLLSVSGTHDQITQLYESPKYTLVTTEDELNQIEEHDAIMHPKEGKNVLSGMSTAVALKKQPIPQSVFPMSASRRLLNAGGTITVYANCLTATTRAKIEVGSPGCKSNCVATSDSSGAQPEVHLYRAAYTLNYYVTCGGNQQYVALHNYNYAGTAPLGVSFASGTQTVHLNGQNEYWLYGNGWMMKLKMHVAPSCGVRHNAGITCANSLRYVTSDRQGRSAMTTSNPDYDSNCCVEGTCQNLNSRYVYPWNQQGSYLQKCESPYLQEKSGVANTNVQQITLDALHPDSFRRKCCRFSYCNEAQASASCGADYEYDSSRAGTQLSAATQTDYKTKCCRPSRNCNVAAKNGFICTNGKMMPISRLSFDVTSALATWTNTDPTVSTHHQDEFNTKCCTIFSTCATTEMIFANTASTSSLRAAQSTLTSYSPSTCPAQWQTLTDTPSSVTVTNPGK